MYLVLDRTVKRDPWSPKGQRVYSAYYGDHAVIAVTGAFSSHGPLKSEITDRFRAREAVELLEGLIKRRKIALISDKSPARRSRRVQGFIDDNRHRLRVMEFPTGRPELNASENGWSVIKSAPFNRRHYESADERIGAVNEFLNTYDLDRR